MINLLDAAGYTSIVATNCEQTYARYLQPGEQVSVRTELEDLVGPKRTALGEGWFVTTRNTWYVGDEAVATMLFRVLKFAPAAPAAPAARKNNSASAPCPVTPSPSSRAGCSPWLAPVAPPRHDDQAAQRGTLADDASRPRVGVRGALAAATTLNE
jgi:hypothetical protein